MVTEAAPAEARCSEARPTAAPPTATIPSALAVGVFSTFVGFHVAGLVEYNFGDSEVLEAFFLVMGLGLVVHEPIQRDK